MFCKNCGTKIEDGSRFCSNCGIKLIDNTLEGNKFLEKEEEASITVRPIGLASELCVTTTAVEEAMKSLGIKKGLSDFLEPAEERKLRKHLENAERYEIRGISDSVRNVTTCSGVGGNFYESNNDNSEDEIEWGKVARVAYIVGKTFFGG